MVFSYYERSIMDKLKSLTKNKWVWIIALSLTALVGGRTLGDQITEAILAILGS